MRNLLWVIFLWVQCDYWGKSGDTSIRGGERRDGGALCRPLRPAQEKRSSARPALHFNKIKWTNNARFRFTVRERTREFHENSLLVPIRAFGTLI